MYFVTTDPAGDSNDDRDWERHLDAQVNQISAGLYSPAGGGWGQIHESAEIYYRWQGATKGPVHLMTDRIGDAGYPQALAIYSIYQPFGGISRGADIFTGVPTDRYVIGEPWYRSDLIRYGASPSS